MLATISSDGKNEKSICWRTQICVLFESTGKESRTLEDINLIKYTEFILSVLPGIQAFRQIWSFVIHISTSISGR